MSYSKHCNDLIESLVAQAADERRQQLQEIPKKTPPKTLHERLRYIRKKRGLTQKKVAEKLGVTAQCYSKYEKNPETINLASLLKLMDILDTNWYFLTGQEKSQRSYIPSDLAGKEEDRLLLSLFRTLPSDYRKLFLACALCFSQNIEEDTNAYSEVLLFSEEFVEHLALVKNLLMKKVAAEGSL